MKELVSIIIPTYNEEKFIRGTLVSFLQQELTGFDIEILVVDGGSTDATIKIIEELQSHNEKIKLLNNKKKRAPYAFNIGINESNGEYVLIAGAHSLYPNNYIKVCLKELKCKDADGCSGRTVTKPSSQSFSAQLAAWIVGHPFGTSPNSFRNVKEGFTSTLPRAVYKKSTLIDVGLYNEGLYRNQDNDLNQRIIDRGGKLYYTWETNSVYYAKENITSLLKFAYINGTWNILSLKQNPKSMKAHHFIPLIFVLLLTMLLITSLLYESSILIIIFTAIMVVHLFVGGLFSLKLFFKNKSTYTLFLPLCFLAFHLCYGVGSLVAIFTIIKNSLLSLFIKKSYFGNNHENSR